MKYNEIQCNDLYIFYQKFQLNETSLIHFMHIPLIAVIDTNKERVAIAR